MRPLDEVQRLALSAEAAIAQLLPHQADRRLQILARLLEWVEIDPVTGCWIWTGATSGNGRGGDYPRLKFEGRTVVAHRLSGFLFFGYVPTHKQLDHTCRRRLCIFPGHLEIVTHRVNQLRRDQARLEALNGSPRA